MPQQEVRLPDFTEPAAGPGWAQGHLLTPQSSRTPALPLDRGAPKAREVDPRIQSHITNARKQG